MAPKEGNLPPDEGAWEIILAPIAKKRLAKIPQPDRRRILTAIARLSGGPCGDIAPLRGREEWRLRVGGWRVLLLINSSVQSITITYVDARGGVYKK